MSNLLQFSANVEIEAAAGDSTKQPRVSILAYSGGLMSVGRYGTVAIDLKGLELSASAMPLLVDHNANIDGIAGSGTPSVLNNQLAVNGTLAPTSEAAQKLIALSKAGVSFGASVGVEPTKQEFIKAGSAVVVNGQTIKSDRDFMLVRSGKLREVSILSVPADSTTSVSIAAGLHRKGNTTMTVENQNVQVPEEMKCAWDKSGLSDNARIQARWNGANFSDEGIRNQMQSVMIEAAGGGMTFADFDVAMVRAENRDLRLKAIYDKMPKAPSIHNSNRDIPGGDEKSLLMAAATLHLAGDGAAERIYGEHVTEGARRLGARSIIGLCEAGLRLKGASTGGNSHELLKAGFSTLNLPGILGDSANKILLDVYRSFPSNARTTCRKLSASDFKNHTGYRLGGNAVMEEVGAAGEIKHGNLTESSFTYRIATYAKMFAITRQQLINDDIQSFAQLPTLIGRGALTKLENTWATLLLSNPSSFFSAGNKNYISGVEMTLTEGGLTAALTLFRAAVDGNGDPIMVQPKYLLVPPELETTARRILLSTNLLNNEGVVYDQGSNNPFYKLAEPLICPHLSNSKFTGYSALAWYLWGDPADVAAMAVAYLDNMENPTIETADADFNTLGMQLRGFWILVSAWPNTPEP